MAKLSVTNEEIVNKLEEFNLPVFYGEIDENEIKSYNFFYYREERLKGSERYLTQEIHIFYVSMNQSDLMESEIISALKSIRLHFDEAFYDRLKIDKTSNYVDVVTFVCTRKMRLECHG